MSSNIMIVIDPTQGTSARLLDRPATLAELQEAVGGWIELVPWWHTWHAEGDEPCQVFCNEEGRLRKLPLNEAATALWQAELLTEMEAKHLREINAREAALIQAEFLCGPVVVLTGKARTR